MANYSYKDVQSRITEECLDRFKKMSGGDEPDFDANYDGGLWELVDILLDIQEEEIERLKLHNESLEKCNAELFKELECLTKS